MSAANRGSGPSFLGSWDFSSCPRRPRPRERSRRHAPRSACAPRRGNTSPRGGAAVYCRAMTDTLALPAGRVRAHLAVTPLAVASALPLVAFFALAYLSVARIQNFHAGRLDLDIQGQVIWNTAHGRPFASTVLKENDT